MSLAGATRAQLRLLAVLEGTRAAVRGGLLAGPVYLVLWLITGVLLPVGQRILPAPGVGLVVAWAGLIAVLTAGGALAAAVSARAATISPLGLTRRIPRPLGPAAGLLPMAR